MDPAAFTYPVNPLSGPTPVPHPGLAPPAAPAAPTPAAPALVDTAPVTYRPIYCATGC